MPGFGEQITYAGYLFPASFLLSEIDYDLQLDPVDIPFAAGSYTPTGKLNPKTYMMTGTYGGSGAVLDATGAHMLTPDAVQAEVDRLFSVMLLGEQPLQWRPDRYSLAQMSRPKLTYSTGQGYRFVDVSIGFTANDPRSYSLVVHSAVAAAGGTTLINLGNTRAYPLITLTFTSTCVNPSVTIATAVGGQAVHTQLAGTFNIGSSVAITTDPRARSVVYNGVKTWGIVNMAGSTNTIVGDTSLLPFIVPSTLGVAASVGATSGQAVATITWRDTWN